MLNSWNSKGLKDLADYMAKTWIHCTENGWYEGASNYVASNNGLESINKTIKTTHVLRKKMKFNEFTKCGPDIVNHWSVTSMV